MLWHVLCNFFFFYFSVQLLSRWLLWCIVALSMHVMRVAGYTEVVWHTKCSTNSTMSNIVFIYFWRTLFSFIYVFNLFLINSTSSVFFFRCFCSDCFFLSCLSIILFASFFCLCCSLFSCIHTAVTRCVIRCKIKMLLGELNRGENEF